MTKLNLRELCLGYATRLRYIKRFSVSHVQHIENVAEHSYYAALYAMLIGRQIPAVQIGLLLQKALIHDVDEAFSGDVIRMYHRDGGVLEAAVHARSKTMVSKFCDAVSTDPSDSAKLEQMWDTAKDPGNLEGRILAYADFLSVLSYAAQEVDCGNRRILDHLSDIQEYAKQFTRDPAYEPILAVVEGHDELVEWLAQELLHRKGTNPCPTPPTTHSVVG
jgi:5'-deoxynucleotidase YfbR-like HD superfamily hydrolase